jgi:peptidyl-prolyl cis-trans isomerase C
MNRVLLLLVLAAATAGCQRANTPATNSTGATGATSAPGATSSTTAAPAAATVPPPAPGSVLPGGAPGQAAAPGQAGAPPAKPVPAVLPAVIATVNGEQVQRWEVETAIKQAEANNGGPVPPDKRDSIVRTIIDELVTYHLLAQEARGRKIEVTDAEVEAEMAMIKQGFPTEEAFQQALLLQGVTADQLRQVTRLGMQARKVIDLDITTKVAVPDADVDAFYKQNVEQFKQGDSVRVSHIYFAVPPDAPPAEKNNKRIAAQETLKQLKAGADFATLARQQSNDQSAANGGELGFVEKGKLPPDFEAVAWAMKPGTTSDVVELQTGFHIIKLHERRGPRTAPLSEVRENLKQFLLDQQRQTKLDALITQLKSKTNIQILV